MRFDDVIFLNVGQVLSAHEAALELGGGTSEVLNAGLLESAVLGPQRRVNRAQLVGFIARDFMGGVDVAIDG